MTQQSSSDLPSSSPTTPLEMRNDIQGLLDDCLTTRYGTAAPTYLDSGNPGAIWAKSHVVSGVNYITLYLWDGTDSIELEAFDVDNNVPKVPFKSVGPKAFFTTIGQGFTTSLDYADIEYWSRGSDIANVIVRDRNYNSYTQILAGRTVLNFVGSSTNANQYITPTVESVASGYGGRIPCGEGLTLSGSVLISQEGDPPQDFIAGVQFYDETSSYLGQAATQVNSTTVVDGDCYRLTFSGAAPATTYEAGFFAGRVGGTGTTGSWYMGAPFISMS